MPVLKAGGKRILYIHVPKTGGTSVEHLLRSYGGGVSMYFPRRAGLPCPPQHFHAELLDRMFGMTGGADGAEHEFDFIFMTVRHPISRLLSEYRYQRTFHRVGTANPHGWRLRFNNRPVVAQMLSFDRWCRYALYRYKRDPYFSANHFRPQVEFSIWNPVIYRLEDGLESIRQRLDDLIGVRGNLPEKPRMLSTDRAGSEEHLSESTRLLIQTHYWRDFATYGYDFPISSP
ncbi:sulfotransferase family 2 domain-containing protein [Mycolicibacterium elephantis]|uniref:sulfotransferase family 2 domain-containing protein n=1 Tax=Mycolicibacterium elephantis TaxID=81858 RepID=UPI0009ED321D|nr:sulfotransferase family 2 domain-containing protein [Mycolicibacterium elephantis]